MESEIRVSATLGSASPCKAVKPGQQSGGGAANGPEGGHAGCTVKRVLLTYWRTIDAGNVPKSGVARSRDPEV